jgi:hypothetical protein
MKDKVANLGYQFIYRRDFGVVHVRTRRTVFGRSHLAVRRNPNAAKLPGSRFTGSK